MGWLPWVIPFTRSSQESHSVCDGLWLGPGQRVTLRDEYRHPSTQGIKVVAAPVAELIGHCFQFAQGRHRRCHHLLAGYVRYSSLICTVLSMIEKIGKPAAGKSAKTQPPMRYSPSDAAAAAICSCSKAGAKSSRSAARSPTSALSATLRQFATAAYTSPSTANACALSSAK